MTAQDDETPGVVRFQSAKRRYGNRLEGRREALWTAGIFPGAELRRPGCRTIDGLDIGINNEVLPGRTNDAGISERVISRVTMLTG